MHQHRIIIGVWKAARHLEEEQSSRKSGTHLATPAIKVKPVKKAMEEKIGVDSVNGEEPQKSPVLEVPEVPEQLNAAF